MRRIVSVVIDVPDVGNIVGFEVLVNTLADSDEPVLLAA